MHQLYHPLHLSTLIILGNNEYKTYVSALRICLMLYTALSFLGSNTFLGKVFDGSEKNGLLLSLNSLCLKV